MNLTPAETIIAAGLRELPQKNLDRLVAHLAAGLPMQFKTGWDYQKGDESAVYGCILGVAVTPLEWRDGVRSEAIHCMSLSGLILFYEQFHRNLPGFSPAMLARLSELVNAEVERWATEPANASVDSNVLSLA